LILNFFDFSSGIFNFRLHGTLDFFLASWAALISARTGVSVTIRDFCRFRLPEDFLAPALGMGVNFSSVTGENWQDAIPPGTGADVVASAFDGLMTVAEEQVAVTSDINWLATSTEREVDAVATAVDSIAGAMLAKDEFFDD